MARCIITNSETISENFVSLNKEIGFTDYNTISFKKLRGGVFKKRKVKNENYLINSNGFISVIGTWFYNGKMGLDTLRIMYDDFQGECVSQFRKKMIGNYLFMICKDDELYVFTDPGGIHYAYYWKSEQDWMIGSSLYEMAKSIDKIEVSAFNVISEAYNAYIIDNETIFKGFYRLMGDEYIKYSSKENQYKICQFADPLLIVDNRGLNEIIEDAVSAYAEISNVIKKNFSNNDVALCITGGVDSRSLLAAFLAADIKPSFYYGVGNSMLTHTMKGDLEVDRMFASRYDMPLRVMDWSTPEVIDEYWDEAIKNYGTMSWLYGASESVFSSCEGIEPSLVFTGYFGELYRNNSVIEKTTKQSLSIDEIYEECGFYYDDLKIILDKSYNEYVTLEKEKIKKVLNPYLDCEGRLPVDLFPVFEYAKRRHSDTFFTNFINQTHYSFLVMAEPEIVKLSCIPHEYKKDYRYMLELIKRIYPDLLNVPFYSRYTWKKYDSDNNLIINQDTGSPNLKTRIKSYLARTLANISKPLYTFIVDKHKHNYSVNQLELVNQLQKLIKNNDFPFIPDTLNSSWIARDGKFAIIMRMLKLMNVERKGC